MSNVPEMPAPEEMEVIHRLDEIFTPSAMKERLRLYPGREGSARFVHYTTADAALKIIQTKRLWMRNAMCMTDYSEVNHGFDMLKRFLLETARHDSLVTALGDCFPDGEQWARDVIRSFSTRVPQLARYTYIASVSEHNVAQENEYGRLSMWRAFGAAADRVAIVFSIPWLSKTPLELGLTFSPVTYWSESQVGQEFDSVIEKVRSGAQFLRNVRRREWITGALMNMLRATVTCLKHVAFSEEKEWRALYDPTWIRSNLMARSVECIHGIPQHVCQIPLEGNDLALATIFDRLIIGPTQYPWPMLDAFVDALTDSGVADAHRKMFMSFIPIRT